MTKRQWSRWVATDHAVGDSDAVRKRAAQQARNDVDMYKHTGKRAYLWQAIAKCCATGCEFPLEVTAYLLRVARNLERRQHERAGLDRVIAEATELRPKAQMKNADVFPSQADFRDATLRTHDGEKVEAVAKDWGVDIGTVSKAKKVRAE